MHIIKTFFNNNGHIQIMIYNRLQAQGFKVALNPTNRTFLKLCQKVYPIILMKSWQYKKIPPGRFWKPLKL